MAERGGQPRALCVDLLQAAGDPTSSQGPRLLLALAVRVLAIQSVYQFFLDASTSHFFLRASQLLWCWQSSRPSLHAFLLMFSNAIVLMAHIIPRPTFLPLVLSFTFPYPGNDPEWTPSRFLLVATDILICVLQFFIMKLRMAIRPVIPTDTFPPLSESLAPVQAEEFAAAVDGEVAEGDLFGGGAGGAGGGAPRHMALQDFENQQNVVQQQQDLAAVRPRRGGGS